jgi:hypothetical protein
VPVTSLAPCVLGSAEGFLTSSGTFSFALDPWDVDNSDGYVLRVNPATSGSGYASLATLDAAGQPGNFNAAAV